jgi:DNA-binding transcriptional ArsR family regulator
MKSKHLLTEKKDGSYMKKIAVVQPETMKSALHPIRWQILNMLCKEEMYPMEIAKKLGIHEQKVYNHIRKLEKAKMIKVVREEEFRGGTARFYTVNHPAFAVELPTGEKKVRMKKVGEEKVMDFFSEFNEDGRFAGSIVVGSPDAHGPFKSRARDGHYATHLALALGQFLDMPKEFVVKLDVDAKEGDSVVVGGPGTNMLCYKLNKHLPVRFNVKKTEQGFLFGGLFSDRTKKVYTEASTGVIAKVKKDGRTYIVIAGVTAVGTKSAVIALTSFGSEALKNYNGAPFAAVIQGFDLDGDGRVDSVEVLE